MEEETTANWKLETWNWKLGETGGKSRYWWRDLCWIVSSPVSTSIHQCRNFSFTCQFASLKGRYVKFDCWSLDLTHSVLLTLWLRCLDTPHLYTVNVSGSCTFCPITFSVVLFLHPNPHTSCLFFPFFFLVLI